MYLELTDSEAIRNHRQRSLAYGTTLAAERLNRSTFMKTRTFYSAIAALGLVVFNSQALALPVSLDGAGNFAVLEIGHGNVSIANASNAGFIIGNVGANGGNLSDSGTPITGNVVTSSSASVNPNVNITDVSGTITQNSALLALAASDAIIASNTASTLPASGTSPIIVSDSINLNTGLTYDLNPGVYDLTSLTLQNGTTLDLVAGGSYVFNIAGQLSLNSSKILDSTPDDVLFNFTGNQGAQFSGGLSQESVLDGILLAPDVPVSITPGLVVGEIISGGNIQIASGAQVQGVNSVPDNGSSLFLLSIGLGCLFLAKRNFLLRSLK